MRICGKCGFKFVNNSHVEAQRHREKCDPDPVGHRERVLRFLRRSAAGRAAHITSKAQSNGKRG